MPDSCQLDCRNAETGRSLPECSQLRQDKLLDDSFNLSVKASAQVSFSLLCWRMKVREVLRLLKDDGWYLITTEGSHRQFKHPTKRGRVTLAGHPRDDIHPKTLKSILVQASLTEK